MEDEKKLAKDKVDEYEVEERIGIPVRCVDNYCKVNTWCEQYKQWQQDNE